jgi:hypothetical protein
MFKILMLHALSGLSDEQAEFQIMDRRTLGRFLGFLDGAGKTSHRISRQIPMLPTEGNITCGSYAKQS